mmetsp:Transcript_24292/g.18478  ORF Transcript_24292/g.18478 Transcript_24292/m.18478 type:complete len:138 (+) Transcript_24292:154-567(+)
MAKMEDDSDKIQDVHGHITSISVLRSHRKLGIATKLMRASAHAMKTVFEAEYVSLHVRVSNTAAIGLYRDVLGFQVNKIDYGYYADGEDAFDMKLYFNQKQPIEVKPNEEDKEAEALDQNNNPAIQLAEERGPLTKN